MPLRCFECRYEMEIVAHVCRGSAPGLYFKCEGQEPRADNKSTRSRGGVVNIEPHAIVFHHEIDDADVAGASRRVGHSQDVAAVEGGERLYRMRFRIVRDVGYVAAGIARDRVDPEHGNWPIADFFAFDIVI